jgi:hypothetical protein
MRPSWLDCQRTRGFPLVAALVLVLMVPVSMDVFMTVHHGFVAMLMPFVGVRNRLMAVLMLMLVLAVATHLGLTSFLSTFFKI